VFLACLAVKERTARCAGFSGSSQFVWFVWFVDKIRNCRFAASDRTAPIPPQPKAQLQPMRTLILAAAALLLSACGGVIDRCPNGLSDPPWNSSIPHSHG
jgi:hypothetical protein